MRIVRGPHLLVGPRTVPRGRVPQDAAQEPVPQADLRGYRSGAGGGCAEAGDADVCFSSPLQICYIPLGCILTLRVNNNRLNRREDEFDSKRAYDDFLEQRETIIANLVHGIDVAKTEADLQAYAAANMHSIRANQAREQSEHASFLEQQSLEQEQARLRRQMARQEYENERREAAAQREDALARMAAAAPGGADADAIAKEGQTTVRLKKSSARRSEEERIRQKQAQLRGMDVRKQQAASAATAGQIPPPTTADTAGTDTTTTEVTAEETQETGLTIKGLKKIKPPEPEKPYDPFGGLAPLAANTRGYYVLQDHYPSSYLDRVRADVRAQAGGYDLREYYARTLLEAFAGLGCFVEEEVARRDAMLLGAAGKHVATDAAAAAAVSEGIGP